VNYSLYQEPDLGATETDVGGNAFDSSAVYFMKTLHC
jgi:hypothetical protein